MDEEDPENNPVITNIDDLNDEDNEEFAKLKSKLIATTTTSQIFNHSEVLTSANKDTPKRYVPIETNRVPESLKLSIRQYTKALVNEYKDDKNMMMEQNDKTKKIKIYFCMISMMAI